MRFRFAMFIFVACCVTLSDARQTANIPAPVINEQFANATVASLRNIIQKQYFDTTAIPKIDAALQTALANRKLQTARDLDQFAKLLTDVLYQASHDKHLFVTVTASSDAPPRQQPLSRSEGARLSNYGVAAAEVLSGNVGYVNVTAFFRGNEGASDALDLAMKFVSHADALILDLRNNGGGSPDTAVRLLSYFFEADVPLFRIVPRFGETDSYRTVSIAPALHDKTRPVYVLISGRTWSAGEGVAFILQEHHRALIIGEKTAGAANPAAPQPLNDALSVTVPFGQIKTAVLEKNWEGTGVAPDLPISSADALHAAHVRALQDLLHRSTTDAGRKFLSDALAEVTMARPASK